MMTKNMPLKVVIFLEGGLIQDTFCDMPLEIVVLDLDEQSQERWVRTDSASSPMSEMHAELAKQYKRKR